MPAHSDLLAHSPPGTRPGDTGQLLVDHLEAVANLASEFAVAFGMAEAGRLLGMTHDLGKASKQFQDYLRGGVRGTGLVTAIQVQQPAATSWNPSYP